MSAYLGDFAEDATVHYMWDTFDSSGASITRATDGSIRIYKDNGVAEKTTANGITDTEDFDTQTGIHVLTIDTSNDTGDGGFWVTGSNYTVVLNGATIDGQTVNAVLCHFSIENRYNDVNVASVSANAINAAAIATDAITNAKIATDAIGAAELATDCIASDQLAATAITDIWGQQVESEGTYTAQQVLSITLSALAGVTSAGGATLETPNGVANRIVATVNGSNERTAVTLTPSS